MVVVSLLPHAEFGPNDHREHAPFIKISVEKIYLFEVKRVSNFRFKCESWFMTHNFWLRTFSKRISLIVDIESIPFFWMRRFPALFIVSGCKFNRDKIRIRSNRCQSCWIATNSFYQFILRIWITRFVNWKNLIFVTISSLFVIENSNFVQENFNFLAFSRFDLSCYES